ncbi:vWA domain-containing protein [Mesobacillus subterraneus]|uniref:VWA domain-containing protein n=1 Tax=Mesobacillus subterraneus TaxID=285983 RepID=A0A427TR22_9BACI|nr:vWA domain-containing protein [Mesobacillus subterraneus]RSD26818.1 VWA domain-containing protein [Mesobacillus subterraneus]
MNNNLTEIIFLLDRSGSMAGLESDTVGGFNAFVKKQAELPGETILTTVLFDDEYEVLWNGIKARNVKLTEDEYYVRGSTALLDAIGKTILDVGYRLAKTSEDRKPGKVIFVITTDGMENASREFTYGKVKELIRHQQEKYRWEFIFMGANIDVAREADSLGINLENSFSFEASEKGIESMYDMVSESITEKRMKGVYDDENL